MFPVCSNERLNVFEAVAAESIQPCGVLRESAAAKDERDLVLLAGTSSGLVWPEVVW